MILTYVNAGKSGPEGINYLFSQKDANGKERNPPAELIEGDVLLTKYLIQNNPREKKYSSYALSFRDNEKVTDEQLKEILQSLRDTFCPGLGPDKVNMLAVKHTDKGNTEVHIIINDEILTNGRQFNPFPPGAKSKKLQKDFCAYWNHKLGFEQVVPNPFKATFSRFDAKVPKDRKEEYLKNVGNQEGVTNKERKEKLSEIATKAVMSGKVKNRDDLVKLLEANNCKITRKGKDYLSIVLPGKQKPIRLKGGCFVEDVDYRVLIAEHNTAPKHLETYQFKKLERELENSIKERGGYFERIFGDKPKRMPKQKSLKITTPKEIKLINKAGLEVPQKQSIQPRANNSQNPKNNQTPKVPGSSATNITSGNSLEQLLMNIGSLETKIFALGQQLSQAPASQRSAIERQLGELKSQLTRLQQKLEEARKAELNKNPSKRPKI